MGRGHYLACSNCGEPYELHSSEPEWDADFRLWMETYQVNENCKKKVRQEKLA